MTGRSPVTGPEPIDPAISLTEPGFFLRPDYFEVLRYLRHRHPVHRTADGLLAVSRYEDIRAISRDPVRFVSGRGVLINDPLRDPAGTGRNTWSILHLDPPLHSAYRTLVNRQFTPRAVARLEDRIREVVVGVLEAVPTDRPVDFVDAVAAPVPIAVIAEMFGVADADRALFRRWSDAVIESTDISESERADELGEMAAFLIGHIDSPVTESNDLLTLLKTSSLDGRPLNQAEIMGFCLTLLVAGNETTRTLISGGVEALARHPDQRALLVDDPSLIPGGVEEILRWVTPIQAFGRTAVVDVEIAERHRGGRASSSSCSTPRPTVTRRSFGPTADRFVVDRPTLPTHLAFGFGEHVCIGSSLARLEARVFFEEFLARFPAFELAGEPDLTRSTLVRGARLMPVLLVP